MVCGPSTAKNCILIVVAVTSTVEVRNGARAYTSGEKNDGAKDARTKWSRSRPIFLTRESTISYQTRGIAKRQKLNISSSLPITSIPYSVLDLVCTTIIVLATVHRLDFLLYTPRGTTSRTMHASWRALHVPLG